MPKKKKTTKTTTSSTKVFDVARPGRSAADATSRPVIVGHKPQIKDPMMSSNQDAIRELLDSKKKVELEPGKEAAAAPTAPVPAALVEKPEPVPPEQASITPVESQPTKDATALQLAASEATTDKAANDISSMILGDAVQVEAPKAPAQETIPIPTPNPMQDVAPAPSPAAPVKASVPEPQAPTQNQAAEKPEPAAQQSNQLSGSTGIIYDESPTEQYPKMTEGANTDPLPVLPEEKTPTPKVQVVVSHHKPRPSSAAVIGWFIFVLLLVAVVVDVLLDAGIITLQSVPHTHFF